MFPASSRHVNTILNAASILKGNLHTIGIDGHFLALISSYPSPKYQKFAPIERPPYNALFIEQFQSTIQFHTQIIRYA